MKMWFDLDIMWQIACLFFYLIMIDCIDFLLIARRRVESQTDVWQLMLFLFGRTFRVQLVVLSNIGTRMFRWLSVKS